MCVLSLSCRVPVVCVPLPGESAWARQHVLSGSTTGDSNSVHTVDQDDDDEENDIVPGKKRHVDSLSHSEAGSNPGEAVDTLI